MKQLKFLTFALATALTLGVASCSDDNDEPNPNPGNENGTVNPSTVFAAGLPTQVGDAVITKNSRWRPNHNFRLYSGKVTRRRQHSH